MKTDELFKTFLEEIANELPSHTFGVWFAKLKLISISDDTVTIQIPMQVHKTMLGDTYYSLVQSTFYSITGKEYQFKFLLEEEINDITQIIEQEEVINEIEWNTNLNPKMVFENYVVGETNKLAFTAAKLIADLPGTRYNPLFIYGKSGLGKTHLMHAVGNFIAKNSDKKVLYTTSNDFKTDFTGISSQDRGISSINYANEFKNKYRNVDVLIIDDIQFLVGAELTQQEFFHTFNALHQTNKQIIISSDRSPDDLKKIEERLRSRFCWGLSVDIYPPDFNLRCEIIKEKLKSTNINNKVSKDVIEYIANNCQNDVRHIEGTINRLMAYTAMMIPDAITLNFAVEALKDYVNNNVYTTNSIGNIQQVVADYYKITVDDMKSKKRNSKVIRPRHVAMYLCRTETDENLAKIGLDFGGRDHSTVIAACEKLKNDLEKDPDLDRVLKDIKEKL